MQQVTINRKLLIDYLQKLTKINYYSRILKEKEPKVIYSIVI